MTTKDTILTGENFKLTIVKKNTDETPAKMLPIKKIEYKQPLLLPPPQEKYIKVKKHDFL